MNVFKRMLFRWAYPTYDCEKPVKYIDRNLSFSNRALLDMWIERRDARVVCRDVRSEASRQWWNLQQAMIEFKRHPPPFQLVHHQPHAYVQGLAALVPPGGAYQQSLMNTRAVY